MSSHKRVEELTLKVLDGIASEAEMEELERLVTSDEKARAVHIALVEQEAVLRGGREGLDVAEAVLARVRRTVGEQIEKGVMQKIRDKRRPERRGGAHMETRDLRPIEPEWRWLGSGRFWLVSAAAAAVLVLAVGLHGWHVTSRHAEPQEAFLYGQRELVPGAPTAYRAFVRNAMTSEPMHGARVQFALLDSGGATVWRTAATTAENGIVEVVPELPEDLSEGGYTLKVEASSETGESMISRGVEVKRSFRALVTTDKPLYQPGQTIRIRTLALAKADLRPLAGRDAVIEVQDPKGNKVFKKRMKTSDFGIVSADFQLADQVNTGEYTVTATVGDTASERSVTVKRYRLPKFKVGVRTDRGYYAPGDKVRCDLSADYTFGEPVADAKVRLVASEFVEKMRPFAEATGTTDAEGKLSLELPLKEHFVGTELKKGDAFVTLEATVTDTAGHTQKKTLDLTVTTRPIRIEVFPESSQLVRNVENVLYIVTAYPDGRPAKTTLIVGKTGQRLQTSDVGVAKVKITPTTPRLALTLEAEDRFGVRAQVRRELRVDARVDSLLLRTDRAVYRTGETATLTALSPARRGRVFLDVVKDRRTVLMKGMDVTDGRGEIALDLPSDLFGTLELHAYRIMRDGNIVGDAKVIQVTRADDLTITASLDKKVYRPAEKAILDFVVKRANGAPVQAALGLSGVDEAVFALQEMRPGLERVYFMLQEEILKPRYEICAHPPVTAREVVQEGRPEEPELEEASVVLFSSAEGAAPPARDASETFHQKNARFRREKREYLAGLWGAAALVPILLFLASTLPLIAYAVSRLFRREPVEGVSDSEARDLARAGRWAAIWWTLGFYLPAFVGIIVGVTFDALRRDAVAPIAIMTGAVVGFVTYLVLASWGLAGRRRWEPSAWNISPALIAGGLTLFIILAGARELRRNDEEAALLFAVATGIVALVKLSVWVVRFRRCAAARAAPIMRKVATPVPFAYVLAWVGLLTVVAAADTYPRALSEGTAVMSMFLAGLVAVAVVGAISAAGSSVLKRLSVGKWLRIALSRAALTGAPVFLAGLMVPALLGAKGSARRMRPVMRALAPAMEMAAEVAEDGATRSSLRKMVEREDGKLGEGPEAPTRVRRHFPETLLWKPELITDERGRARLEIPLADSITTWRLAMSAVSARGELGSGTKGLRVFQDFFVDIDFPVALTQHDRVSVPVAVYNYLERPQTVRLEAQPRPWFRLEGDAVRALEIGAKEVTSVYFTIEALKPGRQSLTVKAYGTEMADAVERSVIVEPDGKPFVETINGRLGENLTQEFAIPEGALDGASDLVVKIYPGSFSQVMEGLDSIFRMPYGCFEQTSSVTYPNILVLDYMRRTNQVKPDIEMKALNFINLGYQRLLSFEVKGGGFSLYGKAPARPHLTAYGLMEFSDMADVYEIDPDVISRTRDWLLSKVSSGGRLDRQKAYITWAMAECGEADSRLAPFLDDIARGAQEIDDPYVLALSANALVAAEHSEAKGVLRRLDELKNLVKSEGGELVHWSSAGEGVMYSRGNVLDIETTALAAYAFIKANYRTQTAHKALAWLIEKKDPRGTWYSTQATVLAMRALLAGTGPSGKVEGEVAVTISANGKLGKELMITPETSDVFHLVSLRELVREGKNDVSLEAAGKGSLTYQIVATHYVPWPKEADEAQKEMTIDVKHDTTRLKKDDVLTCRVTIRYNRPGTANMTIVDLGIPPGFQVMPEAFETLKEKNLIERYSMTGRQVILYIRELRGGEPFTFEYKMKAKFPVKVKTPRSEVYQYYEPDVRDEAVPVEIVVL